MKNDVPLAKALAAVNKKIDANTERVSLGFLYLEQEILIMKSLVILLKNVY